MKPGQAPANPLSEDTMDEILAESFPSSDPPSWTLGSEGAVSQPTGRASRSRVVAFLLVAVPLAVLAAVALEAIVWRPASPPQPARNP